MNTYFQKITQVFPRYLLNERWKNKYLKDRNDIHFAYINIYEIETMLNEYSSSLSNNLIIN